MFLAFDTETTGLPLWSDPSDHPRQPHVIQIAAVLMRSDGTEVDTLSTLVKPGPGAVMEPEALKAHGISLARADTEGMECDDLARRFFEMTRQAVLIIGHNISFDIRLMRIFSARHLGLKWDNDIPTFCTMKRSQNIVNLPPTPAMIRSGRNWPKPPKLEECIEHFFGESLDGAHDALVDVRASIRVFRHLTEKLGVSIASPKRASSLPASDNGWPTPDPKPAPAAAFSSNPFA